ncbi:lipoyl(octanoyl) transferase LipB [Rosenbergiella australiborealis]|uniref:Octanoyltransferase n=1 Tax=Rosenbergiella australiborealis TaxID=1544696 RepID=A0ABS5TAB0_9GAMM|nr:lipoyl(octanoyl) transferase LipB [Rosenbergiella australiborealis]MBT0728445.1 lipoyl(octanoyl) transferase LipB [Rosenbergiella australiborealis]
MSQYQSSPDFELPPLIVRHLGLVEWSAVSQAMHKFTDQRTPQTADEIWLVEHPAVFTQGQAGKTEHLLATGDIPVMQSDRGGQVTYHGPGQQIMYVLIDIKRRKLGVRDLVTALENTVIATLADDNLEAYARADAPGVYIAGQKICSLGLRIRRGCSFHGLALNVEMDLSPFARINPCGYADLTMTQLRDQGSQRQIADVRDALVQHFTHAIHYPERVVPPTIPSEHPLYFTSL